MLGLTMIICTYNRRSFLQKLVQSIVSQLPAQCPFEVVIVDNNSVDDTASYAKALCESNDTFRYIFESQQGLSHARNAGASAARYEYLIFIDDDATLGEHYIASLTAMLAKHSPDLFGGPIYPDYADPKPAWFPESLEVRKKASHSGFHANINLSGGNLGVRKEVLASIGGFNPDYGMKGNKVGMLEERLMIEAYRFSTPAEQQKIYYDLDCFIRHHTPRARMTLNFQCKRIYLANYQYMLHCFDKGVVNPSLLIQLQWLRFRESFKRLFLGIPGYWRQRKTKPDAFFKSFIKLVLITADLHGTCAGYWRMRRANKRAAASPQHTSSTTPLNILYLGSTDKDTVYVEKCRPYYDSDFVVSCLRHLDNTAVTYICISQLNAEDLMKLLTEDVNLAALDVIMFDNIRVYKTLMVLRAHMPHVQWVLRAPMPGDTALPRWKSAFANYAKWRKKRDAAKLVRSIYRAVDMVVGSHHPSISKILYDIVAPQRLRIIPSVADTTAVDAAFLREIQASWGAVVDQLRANTIRRSVPATAYQDAKQACAHS